MIHIVREKATKQQIDEMLQELESIIKLAVDIEREILAGGGGMHADCEMALLADGSQQTDIWGAGWVPDTQEVLFDALINIRPNQNNLDMVIQDATIRRRVEAIVRPRLETA